MLAWEVISLFEAVPLRLLYELGAVWFIRNLKAPETNTSTYT